MIFSIFQEVVQKHEKVQILNFGRLPVGQFSLDFKQISDLGYFYLYLKHILWATKSKNFALCPKKGSFYDFELKLVICHTWFDIITGFHFTLQHFQFPFQNFKSFNLKARLDLATDPGCQKVDQDPWTNKTDPQSLNVWSVHNRLPTSPLHLILNQNVL